MWCVAELDEEYIARMEDVLAVYEKPLSAREPGVCINEKPVVLHQEVRSPVAMRPGRSPPGCRISALRNGQCVLRRPAQGGTPFQQGDERPLVARVCRLSAGHCCGLSGGRYHPSGDGQSEFAHPQGGRRTLWCGSRRLAVESVHGALHPEARQLVKPGGDRDQPVLPAMLGPTPDWGSAFSAEGDSGMEPPRESRPSHDPVELYSQAGAPEVWLQNHTVTVLVP